MRLSVFRGGFSREAAQEVTGAPLPTLLNLVNKSLLRRDAATGRYGIHELLRRYSEECLVQSANFEAAYETHGSYYATFLDQSRDGLRSRDQEVTLKKIEVEIDNIHAAWQHMIEHRRLSDLRQAAPGLFFFYTQRGWHKKGLELSAQLVQMLRLAVPSAERDVLLDYALAVEARFHTNLSQVAVGQPLIEESLSLLSDNNLH